jgi:hypothetical protein
LEGGGPDVYGVEASAADGGTGDGGSSDDIGDEVSPDGAPVPRTCVPPSNVPDPLIISGTIIQTNATRSTLAGGATVEVHADADESLLATAITAPDGTYTLPPLATGGHPLPAHAHVIQVGFATTIFFVVDGLRSTTLDTAVYDASVEGDLAISAGVRANPADGIVAVSVRACNEDTDVNAGLAGAVITVVPGSFTRYDSGSGEPLDSGTATRVTAGLAYDFDVQPGRPAVNLLYQGALTTTQVEVVAGAYTRLVDFP